MLAGVAAVMQGHWCWSGLSYCPEVPSPAWVKILAQEREACLDMLY